MNGSDQSRAEPRSTAAQWPALRQAIAWETRLATRAAQHPATAALYEFLLFGIKQAWACLFGAAMLATLLLTHWFYPTNAPLHRYDAITLAAIAIQAAMLKFGLETWQEARAILLFHLVGTAMEIFKTAAGSWIYPEPAFLRVAGVPLFTGFMYAAVGSYLVRAWRVLDLRYLHHPSRAALAALATAAYVNFFTHHYVPDARWLLFAASAILFRRTTVQYRVWCRWRQMPLLLGLALVTLFIWFAENIGTFTRTWIYPHQTAAWTPVGPGKLGAWYLLMLISYAMVTWVNGVRKPDPKP